MRKLLVVLSGGQDSATCLFWAKQNAEEVHAITFNYRQRHSAEIMAAKKIAQLAGISSTHEVVDVGPLLKGTSPLVNPNEKVGHYDSVEALPGGVEPTFIPARNALFLVLASNRAYVIGAHGIVTGVCEADYGGYPDCREDFISSFSSAMHLGLYGTHTAPRHPVYAPLMHLTKRESVLMANGLPGCMEALAFSHTCYDGLYPPNPFNHASLLRARGFDDARLPDPLIMRAVKEGLLPTDYPESGLVQGTKYNDPKVWQATIDERSAKSAKPAVTQAPPPKPVQPPPAPAKVASPPAPAPAKAASPSPAQVPAPAKPPTAASEKK